MAVRLMTPKEYAELFGVSQQAVTRQCRDGTLCAYRIGALWRIPFDEEEVGEYARKNGAYERAAQQ